VTNGDASGEESDEEETSKTDCKPVGGTQHSEEEDENEASVYEPNVARSRQLAGQGNRAAKDGHFEEAVRKYSDAIELYPFDHR